MNRHLATAAITAATLLTIAAPAEATAHGPSVGWDISSWFRPTVELDPTDGLTFTITAHHEIEHRTVTPEQLLDFAHYLTWLAVTARSAAAEASTAPSAAVTTDGQAA
jgi:hypothetical protein